MEELLVLSASRRTDLVGCYPEALCERLGKYPPERVHTVVLWTKSPKNLVLRGGLKEVLSAYAQIYVHLTVTGLGGTAFEPGIPPWEETVGMLGEVVDLARSPERVCWRFDPILEAERNGEEFSNLPYFPRLAQAIEPFGIKQVKVSWVSPYKKVTARMAKTGWRLIQKTAEEKRRQALFLEEVCRQFGFSLTFCAMEGFSVSRCLDGERLARLHPEGLACSPEKARGQRELCGCTKSLDIGWYTDRCRHGCIYCYALP
jgi:DNA repair photolyase